MSVSVVVTCDGCGEVGKLDTRIGLDGSRGWAAKIPEGWEPYPHTGIPLVCEICSKKIKAGMAKIGEDYETAVAKFWDAFTRRH